MKRLKRILGILALTLILFILAGFFFVQHLKPDYGGEREVPGLKGPVTVYFDTFGIPHIYADNELDAFKALGYVHAQDRLWQMELIRRVAPGRLSEVFGEEVLPTDRFFLNLGIAESTREALKLQDPSDPALALTQAYLDGINQFLKDGPAPVEFYLTGLEKEPFTLEDVYNTIGYMAFSFAMAHKTDPFLMEVRERVGMDHLRELLEVSQVSGRQIRTYDNRFRTDTAHAVSAQIGRILNNTPLPALEGSNAWVIGPGKTKSGKVILANDPHIGFAQPSVWYEAHISTPDFEKYGYYMAGIPFPLLGHDSNLAYGLTMFENDDIDFYTEVLNPEDSTRYRDQGEWIPFKTVKKTIRVKGKGEEPFAYRTTERGPVINGVLESLEKAGPVSMAWVYNQGENRLLQALNGLTHARDLPGFEQAVAQIHAPGLNVMYGDARGNVAWWAAARLHKIPDSLSTKLFLEGDSPMRPSPVPFGDNPKAINPPWGYVYSANNAPDSALIGIIPGYYLPEDRARRIEDLLESRKDWDRETVMAMMNDASSPVNSEISANLMAALDRSGLGQEGIEALELLESWEGDYPLESKAAVVFHRWLYYTLENTFKDELGPEGFASLLDTHLFKRLIAPISSRDDFLWWDDVQTDNTRETRVDVIRKSFGQAVASLERDFGSISSSWGWGSVHTVEYEHPIGRVAALRSFFNVGPFPVPGSREVINNLTFPYDSTGAYRVSAGPSTRRIVDFSDLGESLSILPTGQSGNPFSPHYEDQAALYREGKFRKMLWNAGEIKSGAASVLVFRPAE